jgi:alkylated DNA repair protein alkB family protein 6
MLIVVFSGGTPSSEGMVKERLPEWLDSICDRLYSEQFLPARPNHALINEYKGDEGISAHKDGPVYFPRVIILSIGGSTQMTFRDRLREPTQQSALLLKPRSLLVFTKDAYEKFFHEIPVQLMDKVSSEFVNCSPEEIGHSFTRTSRVSITLRVVPVTKQLQ